MSSYNLWIGNSNRTARPGYSTLIALRWPSNHTAWIEQWTRHGLPTIIWARVTPWCVEVSQTCCIMKRLSRYQWGPATKVVAALLIALMFNRPRLKTILHRRILERTATWTGRRRAATTSSTSRTMINTMTAWVVMASRRGLIWDKICTHRIITRCMICTLTRSSPRRPDTSNWTRTSFPRLGPTSIDCHLAVQTSTQIKWRQLR